MRINSFAPAPPRKRFSREIRLFSVDSKRNTEEKFRLKTFLRAYSLWNKIEAQNNHKVCKKMSSGPSWNNLQAKSKKSFYREIKLFRVN